LALVGNVASRHLVDSVLESFRAHTGFPAEGAGLPEDLPGVGWSDQWAFWQQGYTALMATDTAPFRYKHYHTPNDTPDQVDYDRLARVTSGLAYAVEGLVSSGPSTPGP
jgi:hypothetical protein